MTNSDFISFFDAMSLLADRLGERPSDEEFWIWCFWGKDDGGIDAYGGVCRTSGVEPDFHRIPCCGWFGETDISKCANDLIGWHFLRYEINSFHPARYLTAKQLINRWSMPLDGEEQATNYIQRFATEHLDYEDAHPHLRNCFVGANPGANPEFMPLNGVFLLEDILAVEKYCHIEVPLTKDARYVEAKYNSLPVSNAAANGVTKWRESITNGSPIDWDYWKGLNNITPIQAAKLTYGIDPIVWPDDRYAANKPYDAKFNGEKIYRELLEKIKKREQRLDNLSPKWSLVDLVGFLGEDETTFGMRQAIVIVEQSVRQDDTVKSKKERDLSKWMRETWIKEGMPEGTAFFDALKKYVNQPNSPIREHYTSSKDGPGIRWKTGSATNTMTKKTIQTKVSAFKQKLQ